MTNHIKHQVEGIGITKGKREFVAFLQPRLANGATGEYNPLARKSPDAFDIRSNPGEHVSGKVVRIIDRDSLPDSPGSVKKNHYAVKFVDGSKKVYNADTASEACIMAKADIVKEPKWKAVAAIRLYSTAGGG